MSRSDEDKLVQAGAGTRAAIYMVNNSVTPFYKAVVVLVNDVYDVTGTAVTDGCFIVYAPVNEGGTHFAAMELLNYLSGKSEGVCTVTEEEGAVQRRELLPALYREWEEYDYVSVLSRAYREDFPTIGEPVDLTPYLCTYVNGREVAVSYRIRYFTKEDGKRDAELSEAPKDLNTCHAFAKLVLDEGKNAYMTELDGQKYALPLTRHGTGFRTRVCNRTPEWARTKNGAKERSIRKEDRSEFLSSFYVPDTKVRYGCSAFLTALMMPSELKVAPLAASTLVVCYSKMALTACFLVS